jgi:hypothetical protein
MKKVILFSLIIALVVALVLPTVATPAPALASSSITCTPTSLSFTVFVGIPITDSQTLTVNSNGGWKAIDDADWLSFSPRSAFRSGQKDMDVWVSKDLAAGTYTAIITIKDSSGNPITTVPVTVKVIEPKVLGPLGIGVDKNLLKNVFGGEVITEENKYSGFTINLLTNPADVMDMQAIETDGCWGLSLQTVLNNGKMTISGGTLTINGESKEISSGQIFGLSTLMSMAGGLLPIPPDIDLGENYLVMIKTSDSMQYIGIVLGDLPKLLDLLPMLGGLFSGGEPAGTDLSAPPSVDPNTGDSTNQPTNNEPATELVIPLKPILNLLSPLLPAIMNLLSNQTVLNILKPLMSLLPPIMIVMPASVMGELMAGLMPH